MGLVLLYFVGFIVSFVICIIIARWIFGIPHIVRQLELQTANLRVMRLLLSKMAEKDGVSKDEITKILKDVTDLKD